ncbi:MAG: Bacterial lipid biosynthesis acyltransferase [Acidobacteria bacterium]|nr:Bacterial lipid biosynthesis acyltransferase [Acidobacteriota bacterium]
MRHVLETRSFDVAGKLLARLTKLHPGATFSLAAAAGALRHRVTRRWPAVDEVQALFPHLDLSAAEEVAMRIAALHERNRVLVRGIIHHGIDPVRSLVTAADSLLELEGPRILGTFHVGALQAVGPALERLRSPVLAFRNGRLFTPRGSLRVVSTKGNEQARAAALHRALLHLREGGLVVLALDVSPGDGAETHCLGRRLRVAQGAFVLARWTGAPIVPIAARWTSDGIRVEAGGSLRTPQEAADWLERYLLESPSETSLGLLRMLLGVN